MIGRSSVLDLVRRGVTYEEIGRQLDVPPGLAYLIATGIPVDASDVPVPAQPGMKAEPSHQQLGNPPTVAPSSGEDVRTWIRARVEGDPSMVAARRAGAPSGKSKPGSGNRKSGPKREVTK